MSNVETRNSLQDFDMCLAIAQVSIDSQMKVAWKAWKARKKFTGVIDVFKEKDDDGNVIKSDCGLVAQVDPLTIDLAVPNAKQGQVRVKLLLNQVEVTYFDKRGKKDVKTPKSDGWKISFIVDLDKNPVDLKMLQQIDSGAHKGAEAVIKNSGLSEGAFSIEYLFLNFTKVDLLLLGNKEFEIPAGVPEAAKAQAKDSLTLLLQEDLKEYILGTVVRRSTKQALTTFALTDFIFNVRPHTADAQASALEYLGQFEDRKLPADVTASRLKLSDHWLRPEELTGNQGAFAGAMAIGRNVFFDKYLIPHVQEALRGFVFPPVLGFSWGRQAGWKGPEPVRTGMSWQFTDGVPASRVEKNIFLNKIMAFQGYKLKFFRGPGLQPNQVGLSGSVETKLHIDLNTVLDDPLGWAYFEGHRNITGAITFVGRGIGVDFDLKPELTFTLGGVDEDKNELGGLLTVAKELSNVFKSLRITDSSLEDLGKSVNTTFCNGLATNITKTLNSMCQNLDRHAFIPPGGGVFTFQNPKFSASDDLLMDVIYRAP